MLQYFLVWLKARKVEVGQDLGEYALILGLIAIAVITAVALFRGAIESVFTNVAATLNSVVPTAIPTPVI